MRSPARKREHTSTRAHTHKHTLTHKQTRIYVHKYRAAWEISKKPEIQCTCNHKGINVVTNSTFLKLNVCCSLNLNRKCFMHLCLCLKGCLCVHVFAYLFVDVFVCVCVWGKNVNLHCRSSAYHSTAIFFRAWLVPGKKVNCDWVIMVTVSHKRADWLRKR